MKEWIHFSNCQLMHAGGEAFVYRARYKKRETVALKIYKEGLHFNPDFYLALKKNKHANVASIFDYGFYSDRFWSCSEYIEGIASSAVAPFSVPIALHLLKRIVSGLSFLENHHLSHGDLSPDNILITKEGSPVLIDGGIQGVGHLGYAAPERFENAESTVKSDLFSLGILLYFWLTNSLPYEKEEYDSIVEEILHIESSKISVLLHLKNSFSIEEIGALDPIWKGLLQLNSEDRFSSFEELEEHLEIALLKLSKQAICLEKSYKNWLLFLDEKIVEQEVALDQKEVESLNGFSSHSIVKKPFLRVWIFSFILFLLFIISLLFIFGEERKSQNVLESGEQMLERVRSREIPLEPKSKNKGITIENVLRPIDILNKDSL